MNSAAQRPAEKPVADRLLNACDRLADGLEPREHCATLMLVAYHRLQRLERICGLAFAVVDDPRMEVVGSLPFYGGVVGLHARMASLRDALDALEADTRPHGYASPGYHWNGAVGPEAIFTPKLEADDA